jgi:hypothetical protein
MSSGIIQGEALIELPIVIKNNFLQTLKKLCELYRINHVLGSAQI